MVRLRVLCGAVREGSRLTAKRLLLERWTEKLETVLARHDRA